MRVLNAMVPAQVPSGQLARFGCPRIGWACRFEDVESEHGVVQASKCSFDLLSLNVIDTLEAAAASNKNAIARLRRSVNVTFISLALVRSNYNPT